MSYNVLITTFYHYFRFLAKEIYNFSISKKKLLAIYIFIAIFFTLTTKLQFYLITITNRTTLYSMYSNVTLLFTTTQASIIPNNFFESQL